MRVVLFMVLFFIPQVFADSPAEPPQAPPLEVSQDDSPGFYFGVILGVQVGSSKDTTGSLGYNADNQGWNYGESGFIGGAEFGYRYPWLGLDIGPEIELGYLGMGGSGVQPVSPGSDTLGKSSSDFYMALRARVGLDVRHYLIFATGGAIGVNYETQVVDACSVAPCGGSTVDANQKGIAWGYTFGGGVEHSFWKNWSVKVEYLYFNLGSQSFSGSTNLGVQYDWTGQTSGHIVRGGLNYHF
jgi:outer membrane immunogenic protein